MEDSQYFQNVIAEARYHQEKVSKKNIIKFKANNNKEYKLEAIYNSTVYIKKSVLGYLPGFYYLVL